MKGYFCRDRRSDAVSLRLDWQHLDPMANKQLTGGCKGFPGRGAWGARLSSVAIGGGARAPRLFLNRRLSLNIQSAAYCGGARSLLV